MHFIYHHRKNFLYLSYPSFLRAYFPPPLADIICTYLEPLYLNLLEDNFSEYFHHPQISIDSFHFFTDHYYFQLKLGPRLVFILIPCEFYFYCSGGISCTVPLSAKVKRNCGILVNLYNEMMQRSSRCHWNRLFSGNNKLYFHPPYLQAPTENVDENKKFHGKILCSVIVDHWNCSSHNELTVCRLKFHSFM